MRTSVLLLLSLFLTAGCGGGDKHLPSSHPPEYDPKKVYSSPSPRVPQPATEPAQPAVSDEPPIELPSLEPGPNEKGEWRKVPIKPESLQQLKSAKTVCDALFQLVQGLGSAQLFAGAEGAALKKSLGSQAESTAQMLDEQLAESMKQALGPAAANCPAPSAKSRKTSSLKDLSQPARIVLTNSSLSHPLLLAQAALSQGSGDGYTITTTKQKKDAPPGWIGWKTTDRTTRVGNRRETRGNRSTTVLVLGGKALKCPTPDGVVSGDYEYAMMFDQTIMESGATRSVHIGQRAVATLKGQVGDDAKLQYIEVDVSLVIERRGTDPSAVAQGTRYQFRFAPDRGFPMHPTHISVSSALGWGSEGNAADSDTRQYLLAGIMGFSGVLYMQAEQEWWNPNTCVEITFTPTTKTHKLGPNESVPVKTELRTKEEQAVVPAKFKEAKERPREGNGNVSPRQAESQPGAPATFTYKAPATRVRHSGFLVGAVSRAGIAQAKDGEWEVAEASYVLEFQSRIISNEPTAPVESVAAGKVPLTLVEGKDMYRGSGMLGYQTGPPPNRDPCSSLIMGHGTTQLDVAGMFIKLSERTGTAGSQVGSADIELHYLIHPTNETERLYTMVQYQCVPGELVPNPFFYSLYSVSRGAEEINLLKSWTYVGRNGVVAIKRLTSNCGGLCDQEVSIFTLKEAE